jgi:hypothetical protein
MAEDGLHIRDVSQCTNFIPTSFEDSSAVHLCTDMQMPEILKRSQDFPVYIAGLLLRQEMLLRAILYSRYPRRLQYVSE